MQNQRAPVETIGALFASRPDFTHKVLASTQLQGQARTLLAESYSPAPAITAGPCGAS